MCWSSFELRRAQLNRLCRRLLTTGLLQYIPPIMFCVQFTMLAQIVRILSRKATTNALARTTFAVTKIQGGTKVNCFSMVNGYDRNFTVTTNNTIFALPSSLLLPDYYYLHLRYHHQHRHYHHHHHQLRYHHHITTITFVSTIIITIHHHLR